MVRSNFPGKPRSAHRKLISASSCLGTSNEASLVAENIYHGLSAFNATFGLESEQIPTFHGFSPHQVSEAKKAAETSYKHVEKEFEARGVIFVPFLPSKKSRKPHQTADNEGEAETNCKISLLDDKENADKLNCDADSCDRILSTPVASNLTTNCRLKKKILTESMDSLDIFDDKLSNDSDSNSARSKLNKKFVLPCRSIHSSRVIKPNKRFLDIEMDDSETASISSEAGDGQYSQSSNFVPLKKPKLIFNENKGRDACWKIDSINSSSSSYTSTPSTSKSPLNKGILREAILNIELSPIKYDNFKSSRAKANTIVCGVCGAVRFYKSKKQTRKFGVLSCESCRKFIGKMINLLPARNAGSYSGGVLECHNQKGRIGYCDNPSILRNKEWNFKNVKFIHNQRCPACWLNTCIRKYNIPSDKKIGLSKMVPREMRITEFCQEAAPSSCENNESQQLKSDVKVAGWRKQHDKHAKLRKKKHKSAMNSLTSMARFISAVKSRDQTNETRQKKMDIESRIRMAKSLRKRTSATHRSKRPDLTIQKRKSGNGSKTKSKDSFSSQESSSVAVSDMRNKESISQSSNNNSESDETLSSKQLDQVAADGTKNDDTQKSMEFRDTSASALPLARTLQDLEKQQEEETESQTISIDFWENYDPEEVCKTGFALIGSEPIHVHALCFLCGSAGVDKLIHCVSCCEAYHQYCIEMNMHPSKLSLDRNWWRVDWVCPKCTFCTICNDPAPQLCCQRCQKSYHSNCLSPNRQRPQLTDRTWVCPSCLRCKSCNQMNVHKFIGNLPLCSPCFKLRQKGNFCPLCQRCYEDDDYDSKMMECGKCKSWVHAKCEGLSNEKYQVLSYLPESVEYVCRVCCDIPPAPWWLAVEEELKTGYLNVLKCLSKNKKACDILKWSPKKRTADCICRNGLRVRTLRFSDSQTSGTKIIGDSDNKCLSKDSLCDNKQNESASNLSDSDVNESDSFNLNKINSITLNVSNLLHVNVENTDSQVGNYDGLPVDKTVQFSPHATQSDSGIGSTDDELKATSSVDGESNSDDRSFANGQCFCSGLESWTKAAPTLLSIKKKVSSNEYSSLLQFHEDVESVINSILESEDLTKVYHQTLNEVFPWFDPHGSKVYDTHSSCDLSMDDSLELETNNVSDGLKSVIDENVERLLSFEKDYYYLGSKEKDGRMCALCKGISEGPMFEEGRLLYCGHNDWIHSNCALWSSEVFEEIDGSLQNVHSAISRGKMIRCSKCSKKGATIGCCTRNCVETYHFPCAQEANCTFLENKTIRCRLHSSENIEGKILTNGTEFHISRPVYVELERKKKKLINFRNVKLAVGSLHVYNLGKFEPKVSDTSLAIIPIEFCCTRLFWSSVEPWKVVPYQIKTILMDPSADYDGDSDLNYTVDHSVVIESQEEINLAVCEVLSCLCDSVSYREEEINESQTNVNDLLSEQDTIFEDLPNEFFDGVFKDISSKMMSIEDLVAAGDKDDSSQSDSDGNNMIEMSEDDSQNCGSDNPSAKRNCFEFSLSNKLTKVNSGSRGGSSENIFFTKNVHCKDSLEKGDDAFLHVKIQEDYNSSSDRSNATNLLKETNLNSLKLLQVDGQIDYSSCSDTCSSIDESESSWIEEDLHFLESESNLKPNHGNQQLSDCEIPQLDGTIETPDGLENEENPVKCSRCHRTYRTDISYQRHLSNCSTEYMSSSGESDYEDDNRSSSVHDISTETVGSEGGDSLHVSEINIVDDIIVTTPCNMRNMGVFVDETNTGTNENVESMESAIQAVAVDEFETVMGKQNGVRNSFCSSGLSKPRQAASSLQAVEYVNSINCVNGKGRPLDSNEGKASESLTQSVQFSSPIIYQQPQQVLDHQQFSSTSVSAPTFILQQMPQTSINLSSMVQPVNPAPSVQYIAAVESPNTPQYIATPDPLNPGSYRIQQSPIISSIVPQVVGTIIQPPLEQIVTVNGQGPSIDLYTTQNGNNNIFLSRQPAVMGTVMNNPVLCNPMMNNSLLNNSLVNNPVLNNAAVINNSILNNTLISNQVVGSGYQTMATQLIQTSKPGVETTSFVIVNTEPNLRDCHVVPSSIESVETSPWTQPTNWSINKHTCKTTKEVTTMYHANAQLLPDDSQRSQVNCVKVVKKKTTEEMMIETASVNDSFYDKIPAKPISNDDVQLNGGVSNLTKFVNDIPDLFNAHFIPTSGLSSSPPSSFTLNQNSDSTLIKDVQMKCEASVPSCVINKASSFTTNMNQPLSTNFQTNLECSSPVLKPQVKTTQSHDENSDYIEPAISPPYSVSKVFSNEIKNFRTYSGKKISPKLGVNNTRVPIICRIPPIDNPPKSPKSPHCDNLADRRILKPANKIEITEPKMKNGLNKNGNTISKAKANIKNGKKCNKPKVVFEINSGDGFSYSTTNLADAWQKIFEAVQQARAARKLPLLPQNPFKNAEASLRTLGLDNNGLKYLLEQLPGVGRCAKYKPTYHKAKPNIMRQEDLKENKSGCARSEPFSTRKEKYDMFSWLASRHRRPPKLLVATEADLINGNRRSASINLPMAMRFRYLRETSKEAVGVFRSDIHGRGLFCLRDIDAGEMVIEYAGEVIRAALTDKREHFYNSKGIGCYMFRIDDFNVVDATLKGNAARFINHSCEPNCYSRIVDILGKKHILIFAQRRIPQGEELTYDYKFPLEEDKISCHCLSRKCRKYLN